MRLARVVHKSRSFAESDEWDVAQQIGLSPEQRQTIAGELKRRFWGDDPPDIRQAQVG